MQPVTTSLGSVLTTLIPLALVISISPLSIIPAVLVLQTPRPRPAGLAFLGGWLLGLCTLTAVFASSSDALSGLRNSPPTWASYLRIVFGVSPDRVRRLPLVVAAQSLGVTQVDAGL